MAVRMICVHEKWGIVCGALSVDITKLPDKKAPLVRKLVKQSPDGTFTVQSWTELADKANKAGVTLLPVSIYRPRKGWKHCTIKA